MTDCKRFCQVKDRRKEIPGRWAAVCAQRRVSRLLSPAYGMSGGEGHSLRNETKEVGWAPDQRAKELGLCPEGNEETNEGFGQRQVM